MFTIATRLGHHPADQHHGPAADENLENLRGRDTSDEEKGIDGAVPNGTSFQKVQAYLTATQQVTASRHSTETAQALQGCAMNTRINSAITAFVLGVSAFSPPAFAQNYSTIRGEKPSSFFTDRPAPHAFDDLTTGSIGTHWNRGIDRSDKEGNAELNDRYVPNYGMTSGGPRR